MKNNKWILLAEDDVCVAELTMLALDADKLGCTVVVARDGSEALDCLYHRGRFVACGPGRPALVLLDLKMPRVDGLEVLRQIKSAEQLKSVPVVMLTSSREDSDLVRSYALGANAYVVKPVDFQEFSRAVRLIGEFWTTVNEPSPGSGADTRDGQPALVATA
ncbi:MAG TPA: response regulator [Candidatus Acidoferrum sp.]|jgi:CheY-like chemotaxis protein|nr:response regulator [Candidatus Acidoferrum sp.]